MDYNDYLEEEPKEENADPYKYMDTSSLRLSYPLEFKRRNAEMVRESWKNAF